jgi:hypothetical protein
MSNSNEYYGKLNVRFEQRARELYTLGYKYTRTPYGAMFIRKHVFTHDVIAASVVMVAADFDFKHYVDNPININPERY